MDPQVVVAAKPPQSSQFKKLIKPLIGIGLLLTIILVLALLLPKLIKNPAKSVSPVVKTKPTSPTASLEKAIKTTFATAKYKAIVDYTNLASKENNLNKRYEYYQKAFTKMSQAYQTTQNPQFKLVLYQLKDYVKVFPKYQAGDFIIPK